MSEETRAAIQRFHEAFNAHDIEALAGCITDDCLFEDTTPPDGTRHVGKDAVLSAFEGFFTGSPNAHFEVDELITTDDRALVLWRYSWADGHVRGADVMRVRCTNPTSNAAPAICPVWYPSTTTCSPASRKRRGWTCRRPPRRPELTGALR
jgi:ketosteroid isomerase-like protein